MNNSLCDETIRIYFKNQFQKILSLIVFSYNQILDNNEQVYKNYKLRNPPKNVSLENILTNMLVRYIRKNKGKFELGLFGFELEPSTEIDSNNYTEGFLDIKVTNLTSSFDNKNNENIYFALECKRLDLSAKPKLYAEQGIKRFKTGKYSKIVPFGGMIGYSELRQENILEIVEKINDFMGNEHLILSDFIEFDFCFESSHDRINLSNIHLYHLILDYSDIIMD
ncbi:MAG: hypothetical protein LBD03_00705 [Methanobrevibacter sp.]|jgi:hypothetical protein|nr:hypothetical protein [Candidatus Methanovirga procula]